MQQIITKEEKMLEHLLKAEDCAHCKWCCKFNDADISEKPQIFEETKNYITEAFPDAKLEEDEGICYFDMPKAYCEKDNEEQYTCPMLIDGKGCTLAENRMLDCKVWPFRIMDTPKGLAVTLSDECRVVNAKTDAELLEELLGRNVAGIMFEAAGKRPVMIKPYRTSHRIILYQEDFYHGQKKDKP